MENKEENLGCKECGKFEEYCECPKLGDPHQHKWVKGLDVSNKNRSFQWCSSCGEFVYTSPPSKGKPKK